MKGWAVPVFTAIHQGDPQLAWERIQFMSPTELDQFEHTLDAALDLVDARRAATTLLKLHGGGWDAESVEQPTPPP
jgi:hypothetical protein